MHPKEIRPAPVQLIHQMKRRAPNEIEPSTFEQELQRIHQDHGLSNQKFFI